MSKKLVESAGDEEPHGEAGSWTLNSGLNRSIQVSWICLAPVFMAVPCLILISVLPVSLAGVKAVLRGLASFLGLFAVAASCAWILTWIGLGGLFFQAFLRAVGASEDAPEGDGPPLGGALLSQGAWVMALLLILTLQGEILRLQGVRLGGGGLGGSSFSSSGFSSF